MQKKITIVKEVVSWIIFLFVLLLFIFTSYHVFFDNNSDDGFFLFGHRPVLVLSGSMEPYMMTNSIAITKEIDSLDQLEVGDVITYHVTQNDNYLRITHRIIEIDGETIYTKGDNNRVDDRIPLNIENVEAKVTYVFNQSAWLVAKWQSGLAGKVMLISFALTIILFYFLLKMFLSSGFSKNTNISGREEVVGEIYDFESSEHFSNEATSELKGTHENHF